MGLLESCCRGCQARTWCWVHDLCHLVSPSRNLTRSQLSLNSSQTRDGTAYTSLDLWLTAFWSNCSVDGKSACEWSSERGTYEHPWAKEDARASKDGKSCFICRLFPLTFNAMWAFTSFYSVTCTLVTCTAIYNFRPPSSLSLSLIFILQTFFSHHYGRLQGRPWLEKSFE